jgi:crotonobetainyl-CoA:carnitine CoA-transferase CaiB-like acyl-CoA transferase
LKKLMARGPAFLSPYRVLDLSDHRGILAARMLADLGADVIHVEPPAGSYARRVGRLDRDGTSFLWKAYAAGRRSVVLDFDHARDRAAFLQLVKTADFLFESSPLGELERNGLGVSALASVNPRLIHTSITPFGGTGPKAHYQDAEIVMWAAGGALFGARDEDLPPIRVTVPQAYLHAASDAAVGAMIAHFGRLATGRGQHVEISVQQSVAQATLSTVLAETVRDNAFQEELAAVAGAGSANKLDLSGSGSATKRGKNWNVKDGVVELHLAIGPSTGRFTNALFKWIREAGQCDADIAQWDWTKVHQRIQNGEVTAADMDRARAIVARFLAGFKREELIEQSIARKILIAPRMHIDDLARSPHYAARGIFKSVGIGDEARTIIGPPCRLTLDGFKQLGPAPTLGQHNDELLKPLLKEMQLQQASAS